MLTTRCPERSNKMKKQYIYPANEVLYLNAKDIIALSVETDDIADDIFAPIDKAVSE